MKNEVDHFAESTKANHADTASTTAPDVPAVIESVDVPNSSLSSRHSSTKGHNGKSKGKSGKSAHL